MSLGMVFIATSGPVTFPLVVSWNGRFVKFKIEETFVSTALKPGIEALYRAERHKARHTLQKKVNGSGNNEAVEGMAATLYWIHLCLKWVPQKYYYKRSSGKCRTQNTKYQTFSKSQYILNRYH